MQEDPPGNEFGEKTLKKVEKIWEVGNTETDQCLKECPQPEDNALLVNNCDTGDLQMRCNCDHKGLETLSVRCKDHWW